MLPFIASSLRRRGGAAIARPLLPTTAATLLRAPPPHLGPPPTGDHRTNSTGSAQSSRGDGSQAEGAGASRCGRDPAGEDGRGMGEPVDLSQPGPTARSVDQAAIPGVWPPRSPDAPADPADHVNSHGSDPQETIRKGAWRVSETMSDQYDNHEQDHGKGYDKVIPEMAQSLAAKVANAVRNVVAPAAHGEEYEGAAKRLRRDIEGIQEQEPAGPVGEHRFRDEAAKSRSPDEGTGPGASEKQ